MEALKLNTDKFSNENMLVIKLSEYKIYVMINTVEVEI